MSFKPGDDFEFFVHVTDPTTGAAANADSTPTAVFKKNGTTDSVTVTMASTGTTGEYKGNGTIPGTGAGYAGGNRCQAIVTATKTPSGGGAAVTARVVAWSCILDGARVSDLDAKIGTPVDGTASQDVANVQATADALTAFVDTEVAAIKAKTDNLPAAPAAVGSPMTLESGERTAVANEVEAQIIDETDSEKVLTAITNKIAAVNPSLAGLTLAAIAAQVRTELATELARIDAAISSRLATAGYTATPSAASIKDLILGDTASWGATTIGGKINSAGAASDPWALTYQQLLSYAEGTAARIIAGFYPVVWNGPSAVIPGPPADPNVGTVFGYVYRGGLPVSGVALQFDLVTTDDVAAACGYLVDRQPRQVVTDAQGLFTISLERTDAVLPAGSTWRVTSKQIKFRKHDFEVTAGSTNISGLIL